MDDQGTFYDTFDKCERVDYQTEVSRPAARSELCRHDDPIGSQCAADKIQANPDRQQSLREAALELLKKHPRSTARELDYLYSGDEGAMRKTLSGLRDRRLVRVCGHRECKVTGNKKSQTWELGDPEELREADHIRAVRDLH